MDDTHDRQEQAQALVERYTNMATALRRARLLMVTAAQRYRTSVDASDLPALQAALRLVIVALEEPAAFNHAFARTLAGHPSQAVALLEAIAEREQVPASQLQ